MSMRSMWKGAISFGLVNIPVRMYTATEDKSLSFNQLHQECHTPIRYAKFCPTCNREVSHEEIVRGYEVEKGRYVVLEEADFANLPIPTSRAVEILDFIDLQEIDPIYYAKSYYLEPDGALKPYSLLRRAMRDTGKVAIAKIAIRSRESICCVRVYQNALALATMHYPDEVRSIKELSGVTEEPPVSDVELNMATRLIEGLAAPFDPGKYQDNYRLALHQVIAAKTAGKQFHEAPTQEPAPTNVADLMAALEASLRALEAEKARKEAESTPGMTPAQTREPVLISGNRRKR